MRPTRHVLAIALVATALCADRAVAAAPNLRPQVAGVAGKIVTRLSVSLRRVVPSVRVYELRRDGVVSSRVSAPASELRVDHRTRLSPLMLRLPPPTV